MALGTPSSSEPPERLRRQMVAGLIVQQDTVLVVDNIKHGLRREPPGGKVHDGESLEDAVKRELHEELGVEVEVGPLVSVQKAETPEGPFLVHLFLCTITKGKPQAGLEPGKIGGFHWYTVTEISSMDCVVENLRDALPALGPYLTSPAEENR